MTARPPPIVFGANLMGLAYNGRLWTTAFMYIGLDGQRPCSTTALIYIGHEEERPYGTTAFLYISIEG
jgi:hypothetical protein